MWRPGKLRFLIALKDPLPIGRPATAKKHGPLQSRAGRQIRDVGWGYALPFVAPPKTVLILIDARFSSCSPRSNRRTIRQDVAKKIAGGQRLSPD
jgi:hypothetical protein